MMRAAMQTKRLNRRPLAALAVCLAPGVVLGRYMPAFALWMTAAAVFAAAAVCVYPVTRRGGAALALACATLALLGAGLSSAAVGVPAIDAGAKIVTGHVISEPYVNDTGSTVCVLEDARVDGGTVGRVKLYAPASARIACGDVVRADAVLKTPDGARNPGGFDERLYLLSEGIWYKAYAGSVAVTGTRVSAASALTETRSYVSGVIDAVFSADTAPAAKGMLLGDKSSLDTDTYDAFKDTGLAHVLAVSGLHAAILIAAVSGFFKLIRLGRTPALAASLAFIAVYALVTGLSPSVLRAGIMAAVLLIGGYAGRQTDSLSSLSLAFIVSLLVSPLDLFTAGFQLSFGAVFALLTLGVQLKNLLTKALPWRLPDMISAPAAATAGTLPVLASSFHRLSLIGVAVNIALLPLASLAIVLVFVTTLLGLALGPFAAYFAFAAEAAIRLLLTVLEALAVLPFAAINVAAPPWYVAAAVFAALFITSGYLLIPAKLKAALCGALAALALLAVSVRPAEMTLTFLDVGQGDAAVVRTERGGEYFIDGGPPGSADEVVDFAVRSGVTPDAAFASHTDDDHFAGLAALYEAGLLHKVYCSAQELGAVSAAMPDAQVIPLSAGDTVLLDDKTRAVVLYPYGDSGGGGKNELSLVLLIEYAGHSALLTGDITGRAETALFTGLAPVDVYKAAHHGSKTSSYRLPLSVLKPAYSVVSVGENTFGHPDPRAMKALAEYSGAVYTTREDHAVVFHIGEQISVDSYGG